MSPDNVSAFAWVLVGAASWGIFGGALPIAPVALEHTCETELCDIVDLNKVLSWHRWLVACQDRSCNPSVCIVGKCISTFCVGEGC